MVTFVNNTGTDPKSPVVGAVEILRSGTINFSAAGGNPVDHYHHDVERIVLDLHPPYAGTRIGASNPSLNGSNAGIPGGVDRLQINPDLVNRAGIFSNATAANATAILLHEVYHESKIVDREADTLSDAISDLAPGLSASQKIIVRHLAEEIVLRNKVEIVAANNASVQPLEDHLPTGFQLKGILNSYNSYWSATPKLAVSSG